MLIVLILPFRLFEAKISSLGGLFITQRAAVECAVRARGLSCITAQVVTRKNRRRFELSGALGRDSELRWVVI